MSCKKTTSTLWSGAGAGSLCGSAVHRHWLSSLHRCGGVKFSESDLCCFTHKTRGMTRMKSNLSKGTKKNNSKTKKGNKKNDKNPVISKTQFHKMTKTTSKTRRSVLLGESPYEGRTALLAAEPTRFRYTPFLAYLLLPSHGTTARVEICVKNWTNGEILHAIQLFILILAIFCIL